MYFNHLYLNNIFESDQEPSKYVKNCYILVWQSPNVTSFCFTSLNWSTLLNLLNNEYNIRVFLGRRIVVDMEAEIISASPDSSHWITSWFFWYTGFQIWHTISPVTIFRGYDTDCSFVHDFVLLFNEYEIIQLQLNVFIFVVWVQPIPF